jgi:hypothetical protein
MLSLGGAGVFNVGVAALRRALVALAFVVFSIWRVRLLSFQV